ncbi:hypothetical protein D3C80_1631180 [compost metagenome]
MLGTGFCHVLIFVLMLQATHREILNRAAAHIFQQRNRGLYRHDAIRCLSTQRPGGNLHPAHAAGRRDQAVHHGLVLLQQCTAGTDAGEYLVNMLGLDLLGDQADHIRLLGIASPQTHGKRVLDQACIT